VVLVNTSADRAFGDDRFRGHHLADEPVLLAVPRSHPLAAGGPGPVPLAELAGEAWVAGSARVEETLLGASARLGFRPRIEFVVREWTAKFGFVAAGLGVTLVPALAAGALPAGLALRSLDPREVPHRRVLAATLAGRTVPAVVERFLATLREETGRTLGHASAAGQAVDAPAG
jgi:DNA-binding transcriptional LysR family regulator